MKEDEVLQRLLDSLYADYDSLDKKLKLYDYSDPKYLPLTNSKNKIAKSIIALATLMKDPRRAATPENIKRAKEDLAKLVQRIMKDQGDSNKIALITYKDEEGNPISWPTKMRTMVEKDGSFDSRKTRRRVQS